ncbi:MAG: amidase family protein [Rhizobiaceae bacterium]
MNAPIWQWSAVDTARSIKDRTVSSENVVRANVDRMRSANPAVNAVVVDLGDEATELAAATDKKLQSGEKPRLMEGVPVTVKTNVDFAGQANSNGVPAFEGLIATDDSPVVANLKKAGAIIIGLTNTPEFSMRAFTDNPLHGLTLNPWDHNVTCGGSSGGAASSLALGIGALAHGNDIGGSLRWPAHCCGLATLKPTQGRIAAYNPSAPLERPLMAQLFSTQGPFGRSVADVRLGLEVMAARDPRDPWWVPAPIEGPRPEAPVRVALAKVPDELDPDPAIMTIVRKAADHLANVGYAVAEVELPDLNEIWQAWTDILFEEIHTLQEEAMRKVVSDDYLSVLASYDSFSSRLDSQGFMTAISQRTRHIRNWMTLLEDYPVILTPACVHRTYGPREDLGGPDAVRRVFKQGLRFISSINYLGLPAAIVPVGIVDDLPVGVQLIASRFREDIALDAAEAIEQRAGALCPELWAREA